MSSDLLIFDSTTSQTGVGVHFSVMQTADLHVIGSVIDQGFENSKVKRIFQQRYTKVSLFATEQIYNEISSITLGGAGQIEIRLAGDLLYGISLIAVFPDYAISQANLDATNFAGDLTRNTIKKFGFCTNLGASICTKLNFQIDSNPVDQQKTNQTIINNNLMKSYDQRKYFNKLQGNTLTSCSLETSKAGFKIMVPIQFFFSGSPNKSLQYLRGGSPKILIYTELKRLRDLVCYTRNLIGNDFETGLKATKLGYVCQEIFLSEQERVIQIKVPTTVLIEQNQIFESTFTGTTNTFTPTQFNYPCKWMTYGIQKAKYQKQLPFLAYRPNIEGIDQTQDLLKEATTRFILKFASYVGFVTTDATTLLSATSAIGTIVLPASLSPTSLNVATVTTTFDEDSVSGLIKSLFQAGQGTELNTTSWTIDQIFNRIQPYAFTIDSRQRYLQDQSIVLQGGYLTLDEASRSVDLELKNHIPTNVTYIAQTPTASNLKFLFSMFSQGAINTTYGTTNQFPAVVSASFLGKNFFSNVTKDYKFNYGLDDFDVCVTQWDNYGKYINGSGDLLQTFDFVIGSVTRFKLSGFYTQSVHQMNFFPGKSPEGVHVYSFSLNPSQISPSGMLNLTRQTVKLVIKADVEIDDLLFLSAISYNVMDLRGNQLQVIYSMSYN